jgi:hypothetical protein
MSLPAQERSLITAGILAAGVIGSRMTVEVLVVSEDALLPLQQPVEPVGPPTVKSCTGSKFGLACACINDSYCSCDQSDQGLSTGGAGVIDGGLRR